MDIINKIKKDSYNSIKELSQIELENAITFAADKFFNTKSPVISDELYDLLVDFLHLKYPKSKVLKNIGAKVIGKNKVKLDYHLGSMDKIKPTMGKEFEKWISKYKAPYYISDKLDGISALLVYYTNKEIKLFTRGTAEEGMDITPLLKYLNLPTSDKLNLESKNKDILMAFRGELVISKNNFIKWADKMKNPRNSVAGLVNSKKINPLLANDTDIIIYEVIDPPMKIEDQYKTIKKIGFNCVEYKKLDEINFEVLSNLFKNRRTTAEYEIDGLIITNNDKYIRNIKDNPEYAFAFKDILEDQIAITKVIKIEWNISKDGYIKPTLILEPVKIGGVEISRVTGHNAKFIEEHKLGSGSEIQLIRSGDVIPFIQKVLKSSKKPDLPQGQWTWNKTHVDIIADNSSVDQLIKQIHFFFASFDTKGLGEKNVEKLIDAKIDTVLKILQANKNDFLNVSGFKEKSAMNLELSIKKAMTDINMAKLMAASNKLGHGIGFERIKLILDKYPNLFKDYKKWKKDEFIDKIKEVYGWEDKTSNLFVSNFPDFINFYESIKDYVTIKNTLTKTNENEYTGKTIVFSGFRDNELQKKLEESGAKITNSISKNTNILIVKDKNEETSKILKAKELNILILNRDEIKL
jgi:NAD-dependent DNA ligase